MRYRILKTLMYLVLSVSSFLLTSCQMFGGGDEDETSDVDELTQELDSRDAKLRPVMGSEEKDRLLKAYMVAEDLCKRLLKADDQKKIICVPRRDKVVLVRETEWDSYKMCGLYSVPELVLTIGIVAAGLPAVAGASAFVYSSSEYGLCYYQRQYDLSLEIDLTTAIEEARRETSGELKEVFERAVQKINTKSDTLDKQAESLVQALKKATKESLKDLDRAAGVLIKQIYKEIDDVRRSNIPTYGD